MIALIVGASIALIPGFLGAKFFFKGRKLAANALCRRLYIAALLKWITTLLLFALVFSCFSFKAYALFLGFIMAQGIFLIVVNRIASSFVLCPPTPTASPDKCPSADGSLRLQ